ncbi:GNAT family N-acetyltransferase [Arenibaculum pallidiluteum]|uniref:GNAT family N-acetyltransferase n=1 Tax=Arenibaculum pallidiluteum TaxID=2812559 RepID=UPI002E29523C|nr:GNAT family N-acetyltransferase [Arenibaculum pallidiluteum]
MIREARHRDADLLAAMQAEAFPEDRWPALGFMTLMAHPGTTAFLAETAEGPAGFALVRCVADEAEVITLGVRPAFRRRGIAGALLDAMVAKAASSGARSLFLEVAEDNEAGRALYAAYGFAMVGRRPGYYRRNDGTVAALLLKVETGSETTSP